MVSARIRRAGARYVVLFFLLLLAFFHCNGILFLWLGEGLEFEECVSQGSIGGHVTACK